MLRPQGKWITPPEASHIAERYRALARELRDVSRRITDAGGNVDRSWVGGSARNAFFARFDSLPREVSRYADSLDRIADAIAAIQIWVEEQI